MRWDADPTPVVGPSSRTETCELCDRCRGPTSYHHLIPRLVHGKAVRRDWHREQELQNGARLCAAWHRFVHYFRGLGELARHHHTDVLPLDGDEATRFAA